MIDKLMQHGIGVGSDSLPNMLDWSSYSFETGNNSFSPIDGSQWENVFSREGEGYLTFFRYYSSIGHSQPLIKIKADGQETVITGSDFLSPNIPIDVFFPIYFKQDIEIYVKSDKSFRFQYTVALKSGKPTILQTYKDMQIYSAHSSTNLTGGENMVEILGSGYLLSLQVDGYSVSVSGTIQAYAKAIIDGVEVISLRDCPTISSISLNTWASPIRFENGLVINHYTTSTNCNTKTRVLYALD